MLSRDPYRTSLIFSTFPWPLVTPREIQQSILVSQLRGQILIDSFATGKVLFGFCRRMKKVEKSPDDNFSSGADVMFDCSTQTTLLVGSGR